MPSFSARRWNVARIVSDCSPANTSQLISTLLSGPYAAETGVFELARDSSNDHGHSTFQSSLPVRRLSVTSVSRDRWETRIRSIGGFMVPEITGLDAGAVLFFVKG